MGFNSAFKGLIIRTLYLHEQGCEDPCLFCEAERRPRTKNLGETALRDSGKIFILYACCLAN